MEWAATAAQTSWGRSQARELPVPWPSLDRLLTPRGGNTIVVLAAPGVGKTAFALNWAARSGARTLYASADTDRLLMTSQLAALATGDSRTTVEDRMARSTTWRTEYAEAVKSLFPNLVVDFDSAPSIATVVAKSEALTELWGETPELVVLDTASDVAKDGDEFQGWQKLWLNVREASRYLGCVFMLLHHVSQGPAAGGQSAPKLNDGMYKADQFPEMLLGLHESATNEITVSALKNRGGRKGVAMQLIADHAHGRLDDAREPTGVVAGAHE